MANIENKETSSRPINKTTETLIKELETMSDTGLHEVFIFFYRLNHSHGNMIDYKDREGVVTHIDDAGQIHGTWGGCALIPEVDDYMII